MALPIMTFTDPTLGLPIQQPFVTGMRAGSQLAQQLGQMKQRRAMAPFQQKALEAQAALRQAQAAKALRPQVSATDQLRQEYLHGLQTDPTSLRTQLLGMQLRKTATAPGGIQVTTRPEGGMQVQVGGAAPMGVTGAPGQIPTLGGAPLTPEQQKAFSAAFAPAAVPDTMKKLQQQRFVKQMQGLEDEAKASHTDVMPLFDELISTVKKMKVKPGPIAGHALALIPEGQRFLSLLRQAQVSQTKQFKNIRTQREWNAITSQVGSNLFNPSALIPIFKRFRNKAKKSVDMYKFYSNYARKGGQNPDEAFSQWLKQEEGTPTLQGALQPQQKVYTGRGGRSFTQADVEETAKKHNQTPQQVLRNMGVQ